MRYGGINPLDQFRNKVHSEFISLTENIKNNILKSYKKLDHSLEKFDPKKEGLNRPSSTWTYLINDNPFSNFGLDLIMNRNVAITSYGGIIFIFLLPFLAVIKILSKFFKRRIKKL